MGVLGYLYESIYHPNWPRCGLHVATSLQDLIAGYCLQQASDHVMVKISNILYSSGALLFLAQTLILSILLPFTLRTGLQ